MTPRPYRQAVGKGGRSRRSQIGECSSGPGRPASRPGPFCIYGADGLDIRPGADASSDAYVWAISAENPQEFQHKVRFGQPASSMPAQLDMLSLDEVADLSTYAQTVPTAPNAPTSAGEAFSTDDGCAVCHGADATGDFGPSLVGAPSDTILDMLDGTLAHTGGTVDGVTAQDATDLEAWLGSL